MKLTDLDFPSFKAKMAEECKAKKACKEEYKKLLDSNGIHQLFEVLCRNYYWLYENGIDCPIPDNLTVEILDISGCTGITSIPDNLKVDILDISGYTGITPLPDNLKVDILDISGCTCITSLPDNLKVEILYMDGCPDITYIPSGVENVYR